MDVPDIKDLTIWMRDTMRHRGPDDMGLYLSKDKRLCLGHTRLSIIDLSPAGHQPMPNEDESIWMVYNGEIYNYRKIRELLIAKGHKFKGNSDTEVLIHGYEEWGIEHLLNRLRGMFAFAVYDRRPSSVPGRLFLARDRLGIKPLYYYYNKDKFIFASEIKALLLTDISTEISFQGVKLFLSLGYIPAPFTIYREIYSLNPGHFLIVEKDGVKEFKYYDLKETFLSEEDNKISFKKVIERTRNVLLESIRLHLVSDVEVGAFLSGGIDSSSIVSLMRQAGHERIKTVSVIFPDAPKYDEGKYARLISNKFNTDHLEVEIMGKDLLEHIDKIFYSMDQPTVDGVNTYFVSLAAKRAGLKTILSGLGGDEAFGGYPSFQNVPRLYKFLKISKFIPLKFLLLPSLAQRRQKIDYLLKDNSLSFLNTYLIYRGLFTPEQIKNLLVPDLTDELSKPSALGDFSLFNIRNNFNKISFLETSLYMSGQLLRDTDVFSMVHSLEIRVPYVDHKVFEQLAKIPCKYKINNKVPKRLLVEAVGDLPKEIINRPKQGFTFPFDLWMRNELKGFIEDSLNSSLIFNRPFIKRLLMDFYTHKVHWSRIWSLLALTHWLK